MADRTQTSTFSGGARSQARDGRQVFMGTVASRSVNKTSDIADKFKESIDAVDVTDQLQISRVEVERSDADKRATGLHKQAIFDSQQSVQQIAKSYGMTIKVVYRVSEAAPSTSCRIN